MASRLVRLLKSVVPLTMLAHCKIHLPLVVGAGEVRQSGMIDHEGVGLILFLQGYDCCSFDKPMAGYLFMLFEENISSFASFFKL